MFRFRSGQRIPAPCAGESPGIAVDYSSASGDPDAAFGRSPWGLSVSVSSALPERLATHVDPDVHVLMVWDQAGFHTARALTLPPNLTVIALPAYSPELNPVEDLWHYFRSHYWSNRTYADYDALRLAAVEP